MLSMGLSAFYALELAVTCCGAGKLGDEATLLEVLHNCSTALRADVSATAAGLVPAAASHAAAAPATAAGAAARAESASAAVRPGRHASAAGGQRSAQQPPASATANGPAVGRQQWVADPAERRSRQLSDQPPPEWSSDWGPSVTTGLQVCRGCSPCAEAAPVHLTTPMVSAWSLSDMDASPSCSVAGTQAVATIYLGQPHGAEGLQLRPRKVPKEVSHAAVAAFTAGVRALLAYEAALKRGPTHIRCNTQHASKRTLQPMRKQPRLSRNVWAAPMLSVHRRSALHTVVCC